MAPRQIVYSSVSPSNVSSRSLDLCKYLSDLFLPSTKSVELCDFHRTLRVRTCRVRTDGSISTEVPLNEGPGTARIDLKCMVHERAHEERINATSWS